ncbi:MAG: asparagine synthase (glutamine-hydrolyzing) [Candidatus Melainabacteria bacterium RIFCSPHIGHO2_02_FULL_34_12]|nr:MAG: asparagine synthase (glutamine-hydrolyzing) [Candidatus Melainabacteria bacterium RIFCSPHIGHO2_02_FULL_34_12]
MCGIFGVAGSHINENTLIRVVDSLTHRGPDDKGYINLDEKIFFGHTRLAVIDLSSLGKQPMIVENGKICITYNGEIYNYAQIRKELEKSGYSFKSNTDTEVILHLYEQKGEKCLEDLNGMFAFAIYDKEKQQIFLARDRLGIKPLYYACYNNQFIFASEIKAILSANILPRQVNWQAIYNYFSFLFIPCPDTAFEYIKQIPPAHYLIYDLKKTSFKLIKYWSPFNGNLKNNNYEDLKEELTCLLEDSVKLQLVSDVPLGLFLSGGIDSSILALLASKYTSSKLKTYTAIFKGKDYELYNESDNARKISNLITSDHTEVEIDVVDPDKVLDLITCFDQPFANPTFFLSYLISKKMKEHISVVLSGAGGDELFGGYPRYRMLNYAKMLSLVPGFLNKQISEISNLIPESDISHLPRRIKLFLRGAGHSFPEQYLRWTYYLSDNEKANLLRPLLEKESNLTKSVNVINSYLTRADSNDLLNKIQYVDLNTFLLDNVLEYTDKTSMAFGLETRVPYLDHRIVELSFNIPAKYKINHSVTKYILKDIFKKSLPPEVINAPKRGFCAPISKWIDLSFNYYFDNLLTENYVSNQGILDWETIQLFRNRHKLRKRDYSMELFGIIMFDVWYRKYIK